MVSDAFRWQDSERWGVEEGDVGVSDVVWYSPRVLKGCRM